MILRRTTSKCRLLVPCDEVCKRLPHCAVSSSDKDALGFRPHKTSILGVLTFLSHLRLDPDRLCGVPQHVLVSAIAANRSSPHICKGSVAAVWTALVHAFYVICFQLPHTYYGQCCVTSSECCSCFRLSARWLSILLYNAIPQWAQWHRQLALRAQATPIPRVTVRLHRLRAKSVLMQATVPIEQFLYHWQSKLASPQACKLRTYLFNHLQLHPNASRADIQGW